MQCPVGGPGRIGSRRGWAGRNGAGWTIRPFLFDQARSSQTPEPAW